MTEISTAGTGLGKGDTRTMPLTGKPGTTTRPGTRAGLPGSSVGGGFRPVAETQLDWMSRAACTDRGMDPDIFFDPGGRSVAAKRVCRRCPVRRECLNFSGGTMYGIWGGLDGEERRRASRRTRSSEAVAGEAR